jgi:hypothetical protein
MEGRKTIFNFIANYFFRTIIYRPITAASGSINQSQSINLSLNTTNDSTSLLSSRMRSESLAELKNQNKKRIMNSSSVRLNLELERIHSIELTELEEKLKKKSRENKIKKESIKSTSFGETVMLLNENDKISKELIKPPVDDANTTINTTTTMPQIKPTTKKLSIKEETKTQAPAPALTPITQINNLKQERPSSITDERFLCLVSSMVNTYRPSTAKTNENPDETILKLYRSNTAFHRNGSLIALQNQDKQEVVRLSYEENFRRFEKAVSFY